jgi:hypothetical protein
VDASGCPIYRFTNQNFNISLESETCSDNNDGRITITPKVGLSYEVTITGVGLDQTQGFTNMFTISDLNAGTYTICINGTDGTIVYEEFCTQVVISEPDALSVTSKVSGDGTELTVDLVGSDFYNVELNGELVQTQAPSITLDLKNGINSLKVFTDIPCQGVYNEQFIRSDEPLVFPNPFRDMVGVYFVGEGAKVSMRIFSADGRFIKSSLLVIDANGTQIDLGALPNGLYYVQLIGEGIKTTTKIIKE